MVLCRLFILSDNIELCTQANEVPSASEGLQEALDIYPAAKLPEPASLSLDLSTNAPKPSKEVGHEHSSPAQ